MIKLISAGKPEVQGGKVSADLFLDCRIMWNPYRDPVLGKLTGDDPKVQDWIKQENKPVITAFLDLIDTGLKTRSTRNSGRDPQKPFTVCFFCLAGVHRSRGMKHVIGSILRAGGEEVVVE